MSHDRREAGATVGELIAIAGANRDALASLGAASRQHGRSTLSLHPATESVHLRAAPPVRLKSTFRHETSYSSYRINLPKANRKYSRMRGGGLGTVDLAHGEGHKASGKRNRNQVRRERIKTSFEQLSARRKKNECRKNIFEELGIDSGDEMLKMQGKSGNK